MAATSANSTASNQSGPAKARLVEITKFSTDPTPSKAQKVGDPIPVQFNPQSLKLNYQNSVSGSDKAKGSETQFVGSSTSKLDLELLFDTTADGTDVRNRTKKVAYFLSTKPQGSGKTAKLIPPLARFEWGSFVFEGIIVSMGETLDYFSIDGVPLRATVALSMTQPSILILQNPAAQSSAAGNRNLPGTQPMTPVRPGESVPQAAARSGQSSDWKSIAAANNIDDPLRLSAGASLDLNVSAGVSVGAGAAAGGGISAGASIGLGASAGASADAQAGFSAGIGGGAGFAAGASAGVSASAGAGVSAGASAGASFGAGVSAGAGFSAGASAGAGLTGDAGFSAQLDTGASLGLTAGATFGAAASASAGASASASFGGGLQASAAISGG